MSIESSDDKPVRDQVACDVCGSMIGRLQGYQLTTLQVVRSPRFWRDYYERHKGEFVAMGIASYDDLRRSPKQAEVAQTIAGDETPWRVCEQCIELFDVDRERAEIQFFVKGPQC
ncbi:MAG TPA: hypothetical protein VIK33_09220 [Anaerolineae bacterium]